MKFCLKNKVIKVSLLYSFRMSSWSRKRRMFYNSSYFSFLEAYRGFRSTEWILNKGFIIPGIKLLVEIY